jgi:LuxR family maltose regulon positive regulatory protein
MTGYLWKVRLLQAQVQAAQGKQTEASKLLLPVLQETAAEHAYQLSLEHGKSIGPLLSKTLRTASKSKRQAIQEHVHRLLELLPSDTPSTPTPTPTNHQVPVEPESISLQRYQLDPLSPRELEVLEFIALGYTNQALSQQLHISLATVKTHTRNIYSKLDVKNRTQAAQQARTLGILPTRA